MDKFFYKEVINNNDCKYAYYQFQINWIPERIINNNDIDGYIVQKVIFDNTTNIVINKEKENHIEYYEAWKVKNKKIIYDNDSKDPDDSFSCGINDKFGYIKYSLFKKGIISYKSQVYWIGKSNSLYNTVNKWKNKSISMAGDLQSILVEK